jgi:membrane-bound ClpP family serine protease
VPATYRTDKIMPYVTMALFLRLVRGDFAAIREVLLFILGPIFIMIDVYRGRRQFIGF